MSEQSQLSDDRLIRVKDRDNVFRDQKTGAIINTDKAAYAAAVKRRSVSRQEERDRTRLVKRVNNLEKKMDRVIDLLEANLARKENEL